MTPNTTGETEMSQCYVVATDDTFEEIVLRSALPVLLDFWAPWCAPCLALGRVLEEVMPDYEGKVLFVKVNSDENRKLVAQHNLRSLPRLSIYKDGEEVAQVQERTRARLERFMETNFV